MCAWISRTPGAWDKIKNTCIIMNNHRAEPSTFMAKARRIYNQWDGAIKLLKDHLLQLSGCHQAERTRRPHFCLSRLELLRACYQRIRQKADEGMLQDNRIYVWVQWKLTIPGKFAIIKPIAPPDKAPMYDHHGTRRSISGLSSYVEKSSKWDTS